MTHGRRSVSELLDAHGLQPRRSLGQNFVVDPGVVRRIVAISGVGQGDRVAEIGPGLGSLTLALAEAGALVLAIEKDESLLPLLEEVLGGVAPRPTVVLGDALAVDWPSLLVDAAPDSPGIDSGWTLVSNLPYNVAVPIILHVLRTAPMIDKLVVMVQEEVAERLCATPGGRTIGTPTIKVAWFADARTVMKVPPQVFLPVPRAAGAVVQITRREPAGDDAQAETAFDLVDAAYRQRRKMLRSSLAGKVTPEELLASGVEPTARPEELSVQQWARLAGVVLGAST